MAQYKVTLAWEQAVLGRTESYISKNLTDRQATAAINTMIGKRNNLIANTVRWRGIRIAQVDPTTASGFRRSNFYPPGSYAIFQEGVPVIVPATGQRLAGIGGFQTDQGRSVMQIRIRYDTNRWVTRYFAWPPDELIRNELLGLNFGDFPDWTTDLKVFFLELVNNWFIRARRKPNDSLPIPPVVSQIANWVMSANPPTLMGFVLDNMPATGITARSFVQVQGVRRRGTDRVSYNGRYFVQSVVPNTGGTQSTYFLRSTEDGEPDSIKLMGTVYPITYGLFNPQQIIPIRGGVHKTGRPLGMPTGRRRRLISLDP